VTPAEHAEKLRKQAADGVAEAERIEQLAKGYPDLKRHVGRWEKVVYCSPSVNAKVTDYETRYNCGCCGDSPLEFWPYLETSLGRVYSYPASFFIGEKNPFTGCAVAKYGWKDELRNAGIPEALIERASHRFAEEKDEARARFEANLEDATEPPEPLL